MVLDSVPFSFSIRLASVAALKEQIILEKWLAENFEKHKEAFCEVALHFVFPVVKFEFFLVFQILVHLFPC
jgi:CCR4-NOT transcription complex subunit 1 HEAT repeat